ncbi:MAG: alpha/beta fold hydrolase [Magnetococcales bacterium]|nr:alpha/beta fold hydrolase [Magnetococcales bacterium]
MATIHTRGLPLYYQIHGDGPPVLLLNGLGLGLDAWTPQIEGLSSTLRLIVPDNRGAGRSEIGDTPCTIASMAEDAITLLDALEIGTAHVLGLSMGGMIAQELVLRHPIRVRSLILAATASRLSVHTRYVIDVWSRMVQHRVDAELFLREQFGWVFTDRFLAHREMVDGLIALFRTLPFSPAGFIAQTTACLNHDTTDRLPACRTPTLVLVGRDDMLIPVAASEELVRLMTNARLQVLEGEGHGFASECAGAFNNAVLDFVHHMERARE